MRTTLALLLFGLAACTAGETPDRANAPGDDARASSASTNATDVIRAPSGDGFPRLGVAVLEGPRRWCAAFAPDAAAPLTTGQRVMVVFSEPAPVAALDGRIGAQRDRACDTPFPQPRWSDYTFYSVDLIDSMPTALDRVPTEAVVAVSDARWRRGADDIVRASLDAAGAQEELRSCLAGEGRHYTLWSPGPNGTRVRRWHEYFDLGAFVDANCAPEDQGGN